MIKNNITFDGQNINELTFGSGKRVMRICDICGNEHSTTWNKIIRSRRMHNTEKDYCPKCASKLYNSGCNNKAKTTKVRAKMSSAISGKSRTIKENGKFREINRKSYNDGRYICVYVPEETKYVPEHRVILAKHLNKHHSELQQVHHIDGNKRNNDISNLIELDKSEHTQIHKQLEKLAFDLFKSQKIMFDKTNKNYYLSALLELSVLERSLGFEDIAIKQKKNICDSRSDVNISSEIIRGIIRPIPLIASNMSTVIDVDFYKILFKLGAFGIMHRADTQENLIKYTEFIAKECELVAISIGIERDQFDFAKKLIHAGCNILTIDVAHGYSDKILDLGKKIKKYNPNVKIILGNTTHVDLLHECYDFADAIKVGIAQGLACETKNTAGCTEKQFSAVLKFKNISKSYGVPIISDGGIREPADFTKAIAAGANSVMAGSIFASCPESAAELFFYKGEKQKLI